MMTRSLAILTRNRSFFFSFSKNKIFFMIKIGWSFSFSISLVFIFINKLMCASVSIQSSYLLTSSELRECEKCENIYGRTREWKTIKINLRFFSLSFSRDLSLSQCALFHINILFNSVHLTFERWNSARCTHTHTQSPT